MRLLICALLACVAVYIQAHNEVILASVTLSNTTPAQFDVPEVQQAFRLSVSQAAQLSIERVTIQSYATSPTNENDTIVDIVVDVEDGGVLGQGLGLVRIDLSTPQGVFLNVQNLQIGTQNSGFPQNTTLTVTVGYGDNILVDFTHDTRTRYTLVSGSQYAQLDTSTFAFPILSVSASPQQTTNATVIVTFDDYSLSSLSASATVQIAATASNKQQKHHAKFLEPRERLPTRLQPAVVRASAPAFQKQVSPSPSPLPSASTMSVSASNSLITRSGDAATADPILLTNTTTLTVLVTFVNGQVIDMTQDPRTTFTIVAGASLATVAGNVLTSVQNAVSNGLVTVNVTIPGVWSQAPASCSITVAVVANLTLNLAPESTNLGDALYTTILYQYHCSGVYPLLNGKASAMLTNGATYDVTGHQEAYSSSNTSVAEVIDGKVHARGNGTASLSATWAGLSAPSVKLNVSDVSLYIVSIVVFPTTPGTTASYTAGSVVPLTVRVDFADIDYLNSGGFAGLLYTFSSFVSATQTRLAPHLVLDFATTNATSTPISDDGYLSINTNHWTSISASATARFCAGNPIFPNPSPQPSGRVTYTPNLLPENDTQLDIGATSGTHLPTISAVNGLLTVAVRMRVKSPATLQAFHLRIYLDPSGVQVQTCTVDSSGWSTRPFGCTINEPANEVIFAGVDAGSTLTSSTSSTGYAVGIGSFQVKALALGKFYVHAQVLGAVVSNNATAFAGCTPSSPCEAGPAAIGVIRVGTSSKRTSYVEFDFTEDEWLFSPAPAHERAPVQLAPTSNKAVVEKAVCGSNVAGDTDGDCVFGIQDVWLTDRVRRGEASAASLPSDWARLQMHPFYNHASLSSTPALADVRQLLCVLVKQCRFLYSWAVDTVSKQFSLSFAVRTYDNQPVTSGAKTRVLVVVNTTANAFISGPDVVIGSYNSTIVDGVVLAAAAGGITADSFSVRVSSASLLDESLVGVAIVIESAYGTNGITRVPYISTNLLAPTYTSFSPLLSFSIVGPSPSSTVSASASVSATSSISATSSASATPSVSATASTSASATISASPSATASRSPTSSQSATASRSASASLSATATATGSASASPTASVSASSSSSDTPSPSVSATQTSSATSSVSASATASISASPSRTHSSSLSLSNSKSPTPSVSVTASVSPTSSVSATTSTSSSATTTASTSATSSTSASSTVSSSPSTTASISGSSSTSATTSRSRTTSPTPSATSSVSASRTKSPSPSPTVSPSNKPDLCMLAENGNAGPYNREFTALADVTITSQSSSALGFATTRTTASTTSPGLFERTFSTFVPWTSGSTTNTLVAAVGAETNTPNVLASTSASVLSPSTTAQAASVRGLFKTTQLWWDDQRLHVVYLVRDADGRASVASSGLSVSVVLTKDSSSVSVTCGSPSSSSGVGSCVSSSVSGISSWFSESADVSVNGKVQVSYSGSVVCVSDTATLTLVRKPVVSTGSSSGMTLSVPFGGKFPQDTVTVSVSCNTGGYDLNTWGVDISYDSSILTFQSSSLVNTNFDTPSVNSATLGVVSMIATAKDGQSVSGSSVSLVSVTFVVKSSATAGDHANAFSAVVTSMNDTNSFVFVDLEAASVTDHRGSGNSAGSLVVNGLTDVGIYAFATVSELVNAAVLGGSSQTMAVRVFRVNNKFGDSDVEVTSTSVCSLGSGSSAVSVSGGVCNVVVGGSATSGVDSARVDVVWGGFSTTVVFRVWFPESIRIAVEHSELSWVSNTDCAPLFQSTWATAEATLRADSSGQSATVDITPLVQLGTQSGTNNVISVSAVSGNGAHSTSRFRVTGNAPGSDTVVLVRNTTALLAVTNATVVVTQKFVHVTGLDIVVVTGADVSVPSNVAATSTVVAQASLQHFFPAPTSAGRLYVQAQLDDGTRMDISSSTNVSVTSLSSIGLDVERSQDRDWWVNVRRYAVPECGYLLHASWLRCNTTAPSVVASWLLDASKLNETCTANGLGGICGGVVAITVTRSVTPSTTTSTSSSISASPSITPSVSPTISSSPCPSIPPEATIVTRQLEIIVEGVSGEEWSNSQAVQDSVDSAVESIVCGPATIISQTAQGDNTSFIIVEATYWDRFDPEAQNIPRLEAALGGTFADRNVTLYVGPFRIISISFSASGSSSSDNTTIIAIASSIGASMAAALLLAACYRGKRKEKVVVVWLGALKRRRESFLLECERVFNWMDADLDGIINNKDITVCLDIPDNEMRDLIQQFHLSVPNTSGGPDTLTLQDWVTMMESACMPVEGFNSIPAPALLPATMKNIQTLFATMDTTNSGFVVAHQIAQSLGDDIEDVRTRMIQAGVHNNDLRYDDFEDVMLGYDQGRAGRWIARLLASSPQGSELAALIRATYASSSQEQAPLRNADDQPGPSRFGEALKRVNTLMSTIVSENAAPHPHPFAEAASSSTMGQQFFASQQVQPQQQQQQHQQPQSQQQQSQQPQSQQQQRASGQGWTAIVGSWGASSSPATERRQPTQPENPNVAFMAKTIWSRANPRTNDTAEEAHVRAAVLQAHQNGEIAGTDEEFLNLSCALSECSQLDGTITFSDFFQAIHCLIPEDIPLQGFGYFNADNSLAMNPLGGPQSTSGGNHSPPPSRATRRSHSATLVKALAQFNGLDDSPPKQTNQLQPVFPGKRTAANSGRKHNLQLEAALRDLGGSPNLTPLTTPHMPDTPSTVNSPVPPPSETESREMRVLREAFAASVSLSAAFQQKNRLSGDGANSSPTPSSMSLESSATQFHRKQQQRLQQNQFLHQLPSPLPPAGNVVSTTAMIASITQLVEGPLPADSREFFFNVLERLQSMEMDSEINFEEFVVCVQQAAMVTAQGSSVDVGWRVEPSLELLKSKTWQDM